MLVHFSKYNANGNDFIVIDNRTYDLPINDVSRWSGLCDRRAGIGADGVLLLEKSDKVDFKMRYLNADGIEVEMCGNGARTITLFATEYLGGKKKQNYRFETCDGIYECEIDKTWGLRLKMNSPRDVDQVHLEDFNQHFSFLDSLYLNTGVPHAVFEIVDQQELKKFDVYHAGKLVRESARFKNGSNANFISEVHKGEIFVRTYERGVEDETLSCGTGCVAAAVFYAKKYGISNQVKVHTKGGTFLVEYNSDFSEVYLCGNSKEVFKGTIVL